jgi:hypothetical protein
MAGGTFDKLAGKVRPGTYINFESTRQDILGISERGIVLLPLVAHSYGPAKQFITLTNDAPDAALNMLGYSVYDDNSSMWLIREAFKNAKSVIVYIPRQGAQASGVSGSGAVLTASAKYGGSRGNALKYSVTENPLAGYDVTIYLDAVIVAQYEGLTTIEQLIAEGDGWIDFSGSGALEPAAGVSLTGGSDGTLVASDITDFLDQAESVKWNTLAFPLEATSVEGDPTPALYEAVKTKIKYLREDAGKYRKAVVPNFVADYEGIINVSNGVVVSGRSLPAGQAVAWVAGVDAGASNTQSNTYVKYAGATNIIGQKNHAEAVAAINNGELFFSFSEEGDVVVEYDINSLTTFNAPRDKTYRKNRVLRVFDTFAESLMLNFPPNKFDNSPVGWDIMEGLGRAIMKQFFEAGAIKNVDYDNDFLVDRGQSTGDETYFNVGLEPVDSAEKLFFTIKTR